MPLVYSSCYSVTSDIRARGVMNRVFILKLQAGFGMLVKRVK